MPKFASALDQRLCRTVGGKKRIRNSSFGQNSAWNRMRYATGYGVRRALYSCTEITSSYLELTMYPIFVS